MSMSSWLERNNLWNLRLEISEEWVAWIQVGFAHCPLWIVVSIIPSGAQAENRGFIFRLPIDTSTSGSITGWGPGPGNLTTRHQRYPKKESASFLLEANSYRVRGSKKSPWSNPSPITIDFRVQSKRRARAPFPKKYLEVVLVKFCAHTARIDFLSSIIAADFWHKLFMVGWN